MRIFHNDQEHAVSQVGNYLEYYPKYLMYDIYRNYKDMFKCDT